MSTTHARIVAFIAGLLLALYEGAEPLLTGDVPAGKDAYLMALGAALMGYVVKYHRDATPKQVEQKTAVARQDAAAAAVAEVRRSSRPPQPIPGEDTPLERPSRGGQQ
jgi:hypothetical protein